MRLKLSPLTVEISFSKGLVWVIWQPVTILLGHSFFLSVLPLYFFHGNKKLSEFLCVYSTDSVLGCVIFLHISLVLQNSLELFHNQHHVKKPDCRNTLTFPNQSQLALNPKAFCQHLYQMTHYICLYLVCLSCLPSLVFLSLIMHTWNCLEAEPWVFPGRPMPALCFLGIADTCLVLANSYCFSCLVLKWRFMTLRNSCIYYCYYSISASCNETSFPLAISHLLLHEQIWIEGLSAEGYNHCFVCFTVNSSQFSIEAVIFGYPLNWIV